MTQRQGLGWGRSVRWALAVGMALAPWIASASSFTVNPTLVELTADHRTDMINIINAGTTPIRMQVRVMSWAMPTNAPWQLAPSTDLIVTPELLEIPGGQTGAIRIGSKIAVPPSEGAYRLLLTELPVPDDKAAAGRAAQVNVLAEISMPVFLDTPGTAPKIGLTAAGWDNGALKVALSNSGNRRIDPQPVTVRVSDASGHVLDTTSVPGGYLLAGSNASFHAPVRAGVCGRAATVTVSWDPIPGAAVVLPPLTQSVAADPQACAARAP